MQAIVEAVNSGSTLRVTLLPSLQSATIMVAGVQCPSMGRRPAPVAEGAGARSAGAPAGWVGVRRWHWRWWGRAARVGRGALAQRMCWAPAGLPAQRNLFPLG